MNQYKKILGKVMLTGEGYHSSTENYDVLCLVTDKDTDKSYISRKEVPAGTVLTNREYWQPITAHGVSDGGVIILNRTDNSGNIPIYTLNAAVEAVSRVDRKPGTVLGFLSYNNETDELPSWVLYQYNDVTIDNWTNISYWIPLDYSNKFVGWVETEEKLYKEVPFPKVGMYAYVGKEYINSTVYKVINEGTWSNTGEKAFNYVVNIPDEEDLTVKNNTLKLKDKEYNAAAYSGLGRIYLRKNMIGGVNVLTQEMINVPDTIYIIQYDYDLQGVEITIPEGCVLNFQGGSLNNGTIIGTNTRINSNDNKIFSNNTTLNGKWYISEVLPEWFGAFGDGKTDDSSSINTAVAFGLRNNASLKLSKYYAIYSSIIVNNNTYKMYNIKGETDAELIVFCDTLFDSTLSSRSPYITVSNIKIKSTDGNIHYVMNDKFYVNTFISCSFAFMNFINANKYMMSTYFFNCDIKGSRNYEEGAFIKCNAGCHDMLAFGCKYEQNYTSFLNLDTNTEQGCDFRIDECLIQGNTNRPAIVLKKATKIVIENCYFESNNKGHIYCESQGSKELSLISNLFTKTAYPEEEGVYRVVWGNTEHAISIGNRGLEVAEHEKYTEPIAPSFCKFDGNSIYNTVSFGALKDIPKNVKNGHIFIDTDDKYKLKTKSSEKDLIFNYFNSEYERKSNFDNRFPNTIEFPCNMRFSVKGIFGGSTNWNQLYRDGHTLTPVVNHKYYIKETIDGIDNEVISSSINFTSGSINRCCIDLTLIYGVGKEPTVAEFNSNYEQWFGTKIANVHEYNQGEIKGVRDFKLITNGRNLVENRKIKKQHLIVFTTGELASASGYNADEYYYRCPASTVLYLTNGTAAYFYDKNKTFIKSTGGYVTNNTFITPDNTYYVRFGYSAKNIGYCSFFPVENPTNEVLHELAFSVTQITGKPNGSDISEYVFPDGMHRIGNVVDEIISKDNKVYAIKRIGIKSMSEMTFGYLASFSGDTNLFYTNIDRIARNIVCTHYIFRTSEITTNENMYYFFNANNNYVYFKNKNYTDVETFKADMNNCYILYELTTPIEYLVDNLSLSEYYEANKCIGERVESNSGSLSYQPNLLMNYQTSKLIGSGIFDDRPNSDLIDLGFKYYCTDLNKNIYWTENGWVDNNGFSPCINRGSTLKRPIKQFTEQEGTATPTDLNVLFDGYTYKLSYEDYYSIMLIVDGSITWIPETRVNSKVPADVLRRGTTDEMNTLFTPEYVYTYLYVGFVYYNTDTNRFIRVKFINVEGKGTEANPYVYSVTWEPVQYRKNTLSNADVGYQYFDTDLGKYIWWTGSAWVDDTGATV